MKKIYQYILMAVAMIATASCSNELEDTLQPADSGKLQFVVSDFPAFGEGAQTRAIGTQDEGKTSWEDGDVIFIHLYSEKYGDQTATLTFKAEDGNWSSEGTLSYLENENPTITAVYAPGCEISTSNEIVLKDDYEYGMAEYILANTNIADNTLQIEFEPGRAYSRLRIAATANEKVTVTTTGFTPAGPEGATVPASYTLTADDKSNAYLYGTFEVNSTVMVESGDNELATYTFTTATEQSKSYALDATWPYLTFTASADQTMTIKTNNSNYALDESLQYSVNEGEWVQLTTGTAITFGGDNGTLRLRGKSSTGTALSISIYAQISFGNSSVQVACSGDIRTLVDYENYTTANTANARFYNLFRGCTSLTTSPELPATTLADVCYYNMFYGCTSLTTPPELPATTLAANCYKSMFYGCTSLTTAPELPATTLAANCYDYMFGGCTSLTTSPELPATTLAEYCYQNMFYNCKSLTAAPELPATTLAKYCYYNMFSSCISLTTAYELPATTLTEYCYQNMFYNCKSLTAAPELPATTLAKYCYYNMFLGCTSLTTAPKLPATTLAEYCYRYMFQNCKSLTVAPELPATTLAEYCYENMFYNCTSLTTASELPATTLAKYCYQQMFYNCTSLTAAPKLPATTLTTSCYNSMFYNCTSLTIAPELPATTLVSSCYSSMFRNCKNLSSITMLATDISASSCLTVWLSGVASTGTFTKAASMTSLPTGDSGIPEGWTVVDKE